MPKTITLDEARRLLASRDYEAFLDAVETGHRNSRASPTDWPKSCRSKNWLRTFPPWLMQAAGLS